MAAAQRLWRFFRPNGVRARGIGRGGRTPDGLRRRGAAAACQSVLCRPQVFMPRSL